MSITTELRKWAEDSTLQDRVLTTCPPQHAVHGVLETLLRIADRIDGKVASYYVQLPKDAEGIPFHVGDHVEVPDGLPSEGKPWQVGTITRLDLGAMCWHVRVIAGGMGHTYLTENVRHHHKPTVEDVLTEFTAKLIERSRLTNGAAQTIAEYAAKLRLAGEDA